MTINTGSSHTSIGNIATSNGQIDFEDLAHDITVDMQAVQRQLSLAQSAMRVNGKVSLARGIPSPRVAQLQARLRTLSQARRGLAIMSTNGIAVPQGMTRENMPGVLAELAQEFTRNKHTLKNDYTPMGM